MDIINNAENRSEWIEILGRFGWEYSNSQTYLVHPEFGVTHSINWSPTDGAIADFRYRGFSTVTGLKNLEDWAAAVCLWARQSQFQWAKQGSFRPRSEYKTRWDAITEIARGEMYGDAAYVAVREKYLKFATYAPRNNRWYTVSCSLELEGDLLSPKWDDWVDEENLSFEWGDLQEESEDFDWKRCGFLPTAIVGDRLYGGSLKPHGAVITSLAPQEVKASEIGAWHVALDKPESNVVNNNKQEYAIDVPLYEPLWFAKNREAIYGRIDGLDFVVDKIQGYLAEILVAGERTPRLIRTDLDYWNITSNHQFLQKSCPIPLFGSRVVGGSVIDAVRPGYVVIKGDRYVISDYEPYLNQYRVIRKGIESAFPNLQWGAESWKGGPLDRPGQSRVIISNSKTYRGCLSTGQEFISLWKYECDGKPCFDISIRSDRRVFASEDEAIAWAKEKISELISELQPA